MVTVNNLSKAETRFKENKNVALASPEWFKMFDYKWIAGDDREFNLPNIAVITQKQAVKYFGNQNPIGKIIVFENDSQLRLLALSATSLQIQI